MQSPRKKRMIVISSDEDDVPLAQVVKKLKKERSKKDEKPAQESDWRPHGAKYHAVDKVKPLQEDLLAWFEDVREKRGMPWRKRYDKSLTDEEKGQRAYEIWISEVMLQQTQVTTVIPYWQRWMERWPTISDLAKADIEEVNSAWKGLGYYRRARSLLSAAQKVAASPELYNGRLPRDPAVMVSDIDGVGRYTAGAICSMAYGVTTPIVDGNIHRLLSRVLALHAPTTAPLLVKKLWESAEQLVDALEDPEDIGKAGDWNQALMELGSQVCKPVAPECGKCPLRKGCKAYAELSSHPPAPIKSPCDICTPPLDLAPEDIPSSGDGAVGSVTIFPMKKAKAKSRDEWTVACWLSWKGEEKERWLLVKRPEKGLLAGLFEPPSIQVEEDADQEDQLSTARTYISTLLHKSARALSSADSKYHGELVHIFSHIRMTYLVHTLGITTGDEPPSFSEDEDLPEMQWMTKEELLAANIGTGVKKVWDLAYGGKGADKKAKPVKDKAEKKPPMKKIKRDGEKITKRIAMPMMPFEY